MSHRVIRWEEPPKKQGPQGKWDTVGLELRSRPGQWALIYEGKSYADVRYKANLLYNRTSSAFRNREEWEFKTSIPQQGPWRIYARYIGNSKEASDDGVG